MINRGRLIRLTKKLISIKSENPGGDEYDVALFLKRYLRGLGINAEIIEFKKKRSNIIFSLRGKNNKPSLLLSPHLDTVPAGRNWKFSPFGGIIRNNRIYGRGSSDCKGNLAAAIESINSLLEDGVILNYNLIFAATADEEAGSKFGLIPLLKHRILQPDFAVILDASEFEIIVAQKGLMHVRVKVQGKKAHGAYPWQGVNAIDLAINIIRDIEGFKFKYKPNALLKGPTVNIGTIRGGDKVNIVSDWCEFEMDLRFLPKTSENRIIRTIKKIISSHTKSFKIEIMSIQKPYEIYRNHPLVKYLLKAAEDCKIKSRVAGSEGATTITLFQKAQPCGEAVKSISQSCIKRLTDVPAVAFGFASRGCAHISDEYVSIDNLYNGARLLERFIKTLKFEQ